MVYSNLKDQYEHALATLDSNNTLEVFLIILMTLIIIAAIGGIVHLYKKQKKEEIETETFNQRLG